jgi:hypothetical protein
VRRIHVDRPLPSWYITVVLTMLHFGSELGQKLSCDGLFCALIHSLAFNPIRSNSAFLANFRKQTQEYQLDDIDDEVLVEVRVGKQVQSAFHIVSHERHIARGKVYRAGVWWDGFDDHSRTLALDGDDFVLRWRHARRAESVIGEDGAPDRVQGRWEYCRVQHTGGEGV